MSVCATMRREGAGMSRAKTRGIAAYALSLLAILLCTPIFMTVEAGEEATPVASPEAQATPVASPIANFIPVSPPPEWMAQHACDESALREITVTSSSELEEALAHAQAGDRIEMADAVYTGQFIAATSGTEEHRIALCGSRDAIIDGGGWERGGNGLHITGDFWSVQGITVRNAEKGVMLDSANHVVLEQIDVHAIGHEAVHFRTHSSDNVIRDSDIHSTGLDSEHEMWGEGIYLGSAESNWGTYTGGDPDRSDRNHVLRNRIWNTTAESIDIKEGTQGGLIEGNLFDGSTITAGGAWMEVKGNAYVVRGNIGMASPHHGFQAFVVNYPWWGRNNVFAQNTAYVNSSGYGFYIQEPETSGNVVRCDNVVINAGAGITNLPEGCTND